MLRVISGSLGTTFEKQKITKYQRASWAYPTHPQVLTEWRCGCLILQCAKYRLLVPTVNLPVGPWPRGRSGQAQVWGSDLDSPLQGSSARSRDWGSGPTVSRSPGEAKREQRHGTAVRSCPRLPRRPGGCSANKGSPLVPDAYSGADGEGGPKGSQGTPVGGQPYLPPP